MKLVNVLILAILIWPAASLADYLVTGQIDASECTSYLVFDSCSFVKVHAVRDDEGTFYHPGERYPSVTDYDKNKGRCWIQIKSKGGGLFSSAANLVIPQIWYTEEDGQMRKIDVEYLTFPCKKVS